LLLLPVFLFTPFFPVRFAAAFLLMLILSARAYSGYLGRHIRLRRRDRELREFRHEWVSVELLLENTGRLPAFMLSLRDNPGMLPVVRNNKLLCSLRPRSRIVLQWQGYCSERGIFQLGPAQVSAADPLGLFPVALAGGGQTRLFVYPAPARFTEKSPGGLPLGKLLTPNLLYEDLTRRRSIRDYRSGDEPRRINWKLSARSGSLMVNEFEASLAYPLVVFLNLDPLEYPLRKRGAQMERCIEAAAALCLLASGERQELGIIIYSPRSAEPVELIKPSSFTLIPIMERLAALERTGRHTTGGPVAAEGIHATVNATVNATVHGSTRAMFDRGRGLPYGTRLVYTGPDLGDDDYRILHNLRARHLSLEYLIMDERSLAPLVPGNSRRYPMREQGYELV
jgi:uncharacterized protein (DUF58 family)